MMFDIQKRVRETITMRSVPDHVEVKRGTLSSIIRQSGAFEKPV